MLPHVQENAERYVRMEEDCPEAVFHSFKEVVCELFWSSLRKYGISCLIVAKKPLTQHFTSLAPAPTVTGIRQTFNLMLLDGKKVNAVLDETKLIDVLYTVKDVYSKVGPEYMVALDVALASGGSEAIVEGFYSVMAIQKQRCHQSNRMIELRSKIDWLVPYVGCNTDKLVDGIAKLYLEKHTSPGSTHFRTIGQNCKCKIFHGIWPPEPQSNS